MASLETSRAHGGGSLVRSIEGCGRGRYGSILCSPRALLTDFNQGGDTQTGKVALAFSILTVNSLVLDYYTLYEPLQHMVYVVCHGEKSCRGWWVLLGPTQTALMDRCTPPAVGAAAAPPLEDRPWQWHLPDKGPPQLPGVEQNGRTGGS